MCVVLELKLGALLLGGEGSSNIPSPSSDPLMNRPPRGKLLHKLSLISWKSYIIIKVSFFPPDMAFI